MKTLTNRCILACIVTMTWLQANEAGSTTMLSEQTTSPGSIATGAITAGETSPEPPTTGPPTVPPLVETSTAAAQVVTETAPTQGVNEPATTSAQGVNEPATTSDQGVNQPATTSDQGVNQPATTSDQGVNQPATTSDQGGQTGAPQTIAAGSTAPAAPANTASVQTNPAPGSATTSAQGVPTGAPQTNPAGSSAPPAQNTASTQANQPPAATTVQQAAVSTAPAGPLINTTRGIAPTSTTRTPSDSNTCQYSLCSSVSDPHFKTFDNPGWYYNTAGTAPGDFRLHKSKLLEVHVRHHQTCGSVGVTWNCAVAAREGNDILGINACNGFPTAIRYLRSSTASLATITQNGNTYRIKMPSGAYIDVEVYNYIYFNPLQVCSYMNINVYNPLHYTDISSSGLCGNYDLSYSDEVATFYKTPWCTGECDNHRLNPVESYINAHIYAPQCQQSVSIPTTCRCDTTKWYYCPYSYYESPAATFRTLYTDRCIPAGRRKRATTSDDLVITDTDFPVPANDTTFTDVSKNPPTFPTPSNITADQAWQECFKPLNSTPLYLACMHQVDINTTLQNCVNDIMLTDNIERSVSSAVNQVKTACVFNLTAAANSSSANLTEIQQVLQSIASSMDCPGSPTPCSGNGTCNNGVCSCKTGFHGDACSTSGDVVPYAAGFAASSACDGRAGACSTAYVQAFNVFNSTGLMCQVIPIGRAVTPLTAPGTMISSSLVQCSLPSPASPVGVQSSIPVYVWNVSLSNNAVNYSTALQLAVYDSVCWGCSSATNCSQKTTTACFISGKCYASGDPNPVDNKLKCAPLTNPNDWSKGNGLHVNTATLFAIQLVFIGMTAHLY